MSDSDLRAIILDVERLQRIRDGRTPACFTLRREAAEILAGAYLDLLERAGVIDQYAAELVARLGDLGITPPEQTEDLHATLGRSVEQLVYATRIDVRCIGCGCTHFRPCFDDSTDAVAVSACCWLDVDDVARVGICSSCTEHYLRWRKGDRTGPGLLKRPVPHVPAPRVPPITEREQPVSG